MGTTFKRKLEVWVDGALDDLNNPWPFLVLILAILLGLIIMVNSGING